MMAYISKSQMDDLIRRAIAHIGSATANINMQDYVSFRSPDGTNIINIELSIKKISLAARIIAGISNPKNVCIVGSKDYANRAIAKFSDYTGASMTPGRWIPGTLTNQITKQFMEPRIIIICDPAADKQAISECFKANIPVIAFCNTNNSTKFIDVTIPWNHNNPNALALGLWMLALEISHIRGTVGRDEKWDVMPDIFFHKETEEIKMLDDGIIKSDEEGEDEIHASNEGVNWTGAAEWE